MDKKILLTGIILLALAMPPTAGLSVVSTTSVLWDPILFIGGDRVEAIYIADPAICPHVQGDIIPNRIQFQRDFIANADLFVAINGSVDRENVMPFVEKFMTANGYGNVEWTTLQDPSMVWNTPDGARALAREVTGWLVAADPGNATYYEERSGEYIRMIDAADLSGEERTVIPGQEAIVMIWQREAVEDWLGLSVVTVFGPPFYEEGRFVPQMIVDDIINNPEKYPERQVRRREHAVRRDSQGHRGSPPGPGHPGKTGGVHQLPEIDRRRRQHPGGAGIQQRAGDTRG